MWDSKGKGLTAAPIHLHLLPDAELTQGAPASGEAKESALWWLGEVPGHNDRLTGRFWTIANLEKGAKPPGCWKGVCSGTQAVVTCHTAIGRKTIVTSSIKTVNRDQNMASTDSKVTGLPGTCGPVHMLFPLPGTSSTPCFAC